MEEFWGKPIHVYTRAQALEDGALVDVSAMAVEAGFRVSVAVTGGVLADVEHQGEREGRLWDVLYMAWIAARRNPDAGGLVYGLLMPIGHVKKYRAKLHVVPGDDGEPVATIMRPGED